jgi:hypothetical protein
VDDRALNRGVFEALAQALGPRREAGAPAFLEMGCGIGAMVERLWDWGLLAQADYTASISPPNISPRPGRAWRPLPGKKGAEVSETGENGLCSPAPTSPSGSPWKALDIFDFAAREGGRAAWDVLLAQAFLDLVDLENRSAPDFGAAQTGGLLLLHPQF